MCHEQKGCKWVVGRGCNDGKASADTKSSSSCSRMNKSPCRVSNHCKWVKGKGCTSRSSQEKKNSGRNRYEKRKIKTKSCTSFTKSKCKQRKKCKWTVGKGCSDS